MKATQLKRFFKLINENNIAGLKQVAKEIIEDERSKGHIKLAKQLEDLINNGHPKPQLNSSTKLDSSYSFKGMTELPTSRRYNEPLVTIIKHDELKHHMVLPPEIEERFLRIEKEYAARERLAKYNLRPKRKILLYGSPGCGKTMGAERLAWNTGLQLMKVRFDSIISSYFGESASNLRSVIEASMKMPVVLLLDECDFIARSRTTGQDIGEVPRIVNTLLVLLEEYDAPGLLVATTNLENALDKAIFRRFDDAFEIPRPGKPQIEKLLKINLSAISISENINWPQLVEQLDGCSAAIVVAAAQNAAKISILEGKNAVSHEHLEKAIAEVKRFD